VLAFARCGVSQPQLSHLRPDIELRETEMSLELFSEVDLEGRKSNSEIKIRRETKRGEKG
jgi:hypothetical protein